MSKIKDVYERFKVPIKYALFGIGTSVINFGVFILGNEIFPDPNKEFFSIQWWEIVNTAAWLFANIYSFYVNRKFVFKTQNSGKKEFLREILVFFAIRLFSFFISSHIMSQLINLRDIDHNLAKILGVSVEVLINYFTCKLFVFKKNNKN